MSIIAEPKADIASVAQEVHTVKTMVEGLHHRQTQADATMQALQTQQSGLARDHSALDRRVDGVSNHLHLLERLQEQRDQRNEEIHTDMRQKINGMQTFFEGSLGRVESWQESFRDDFRTHMDHEEADRRETIRRLRANTSAILLAGTSIAIGVLGIIITLLVKLAGG
jgi:chromosome segregation ATPase